MTRWSQRVDTHRRPKTQRIVDAAIEVLRDSWPMTVREVFYQLVARQIIENTALCYGAVSDLLTNARLRGEIRWERLEDRTRRPRSVPMWSGPKEFVESVVPQYRRDAWAEQPAYFEVWLEKDALSGIFEDVLAPYGVTLNVGKGFDGWSSVHDAAGRLADGAAILYFGDFDPSGEDMVRSLGQRLGMVGSAPEIVKCALTKADIERYRLPPYPAKKTDSRAAAFVAKHGDVAVELDALPAGVLRDRIVREVESRMDRAALKRTRRREERERKAMIRKFAG